MDSMIQLALQQKLDFLDELIDTLQRDQQAVEYNDPRDIDEAKAFQQMAREDYSRGEFRKAWFEADHAEYLTFFGRSDLDKFSLIRVQILGTIRQDG